MDILKLVKALSDSELVELQESVIMERIRRFNTSKFPPLNEEELKLFETQGKVSTILAYRSRTNQTVLVSKMVVESCFK